MDTSAARAARASTFRFRTLRHAALLALAGQLLLHAWDLAPAGLSDRTGRLKLPDFLQFYTFGRLVAAGGADRLYEPAAHEAIAREVHPRLTLSAFRPNYSPSVAAAMAPLAMLPYSSAMAAFSVALFALYGAAAALLTRSTATLRRDPLTAALLFASWPAMFIAFRYGQISALTLLLAAAAVWCHRRGAAVASGIALGLLVYKPNLLLVPVLVLLIAREWRLLGGLALGAALELGAGIAIAGVSGMLDYVHALSALALSPTLVQLYGPELHSMRGLLQMVGIRGAVLSWLTWMALPLAAMAAASVWRRAGDGRLRWSALVIATVLASPHLLTYDLLLLAVPLVLLVDWLVAAYGTVPAGAWRWGLVLLYAGAWPGTLIARLYHVQISTIGMIVTLWLLWKAAPPSGRS